MYRYCPTCRTPLEERLLDAVLRRACPACEFVAWGNPTPTAMTLVRCGDSFLFIRQPFFPPNHWGLVNGFVEEGETAEHAAVREVHEETGLHVSLAAFAGTFHYPRKNLLLIGFVADSDARDVQPSEELCQWQWVTAPEIANIQLGEATRQIARVATGQADVFGGTQLIPRP